MFGLLLLLARTIVMPSIGKINHFHILMSCMHSMMVVMQKGELTMIWTIMQKSQRMLLLLQMRLMHISHHLLFGLLNVNQVYSFILMKMLMREIWIHLLLWNTYIHLLLCSTCKPLPAQHQHLHKLLLVRNRRPNLVALMKAFMRST